MEDWLLRTAKNRISGPFTADRIRQMIAKGEIGLEDEICQANHYWFFLQERAEVRKFLNVEVPKPGRRAGEDVTETEAVDTDGPTDPQFSPQAQAANAARFAELETQMEERTDTTAILNRGAAVIAKAAAGQPSGSISPLPQPGVRSAPALPQASTRGVPEETGSWKGLTWLFVAVLGFLILMLMKLLGKS